MKDITVLVDEVLKDHIEESYGCSSCDFQAPSDVKGEWPCARVRIASDWKRQHQDLCRAWRNRSGQEIFLVRKFACSVCSEKETGLVCDECITEAHKDSHHDDIASMEIG
jgi:hypothetical protein